MADLLGPEESWLADKGWLDFLVRQELIVGPGWRLSLAGSSRWRRSDDIGGAGWAAPFKAMLDFTPGYLGLATYDLRYDDRRAVPPEGWGESEPRIARDLASGSIAWKYAFLGTLAGPSQGSIDDLAVPRVAERLNLKIDPYPGKDEVAAAYARLLDRARLLDDRHAMSTASLGLSVSLRSLLRSLLAQIPEWGPKTIFKQCRREAVFYEAPTRYIVAGSATWAREVSDPSTLWATPFEVGFQFSPNFKAMVDYSVGFGRRRSTTIDEWRATEAHPTPPAAAEAQVGFAYTFNGMAEHFRACP